MSNDNPGPVAAYPEFLSTRSSNVHGIAFVDGALWLKFQGGKVYRYTGEGIALLADGILNAESAGSYFAKNIRNNAAILCEYVGRQEEVAVQPERSPLADAIREPAPGLCACGATVKPGSITCPACS